MQRDQMDPWRQQILADIGISTWIRRDQLPSLVVDETNPSVLPAPIVGPPLGKTSEAVAEGQNPGLPRQGHSKPQSSAAKSTLAALAQSLDSGSTAQPGGRSGRDFAAANAPAQFETPDQAGRQAPAQPVLYPEVACLWCGDATLFCPPAELHGQVRLVKDILAAAASNWTQATEQVVFRWAELQASGFAAADADRALLAFAEKRIEVATARWVLCTPTLQPLLAQLVLPTRSRLLGLAELADLAREASSKQSLWQTLQTLGAAPGVALGEVPNANG
jgi:hypothetical protein